MFEKKVTNVKRAALADIKYIASTVRGLMALAESLSDADSPEGQMCDTQTRIDALAAEEATLGEKIANCNRQCDEFVAAAEAKAEEITSDAYAFKVDATQLHGHAEQVLHDAKQEAASLIENARVEARATMDREIEALKRKLT